MRSSHHRAAVPSFAHGHWWTIAPSLRGRLLPKKVEDRAWTTLIPSADADTGEVCIAGRLCGAANAGELYLLVHGLGGDAQRPYMRAAAAAIATTGHDSLRISMRGAGESGADFYHAGLASDLNAVLADPRLRNYSRIVVMGFSLGGHVALRLALDPSRDPRIDAVITICSPLDLGANATLLDRPSGWLYRRHVLEGLSEIHTRVHGHSPRFRTIREWDTRVIVPRFGFDSVEHYWESQSAGPRLREVEIPVLFVATQLDPMVPAATLEPFLRRPGARVDVRWLRRGGHVGFPADADLGLPGPRGLFPQVLTWAKQSA